MVKKIILSTKSYLPSPLSPILPWCREKLKEREGIFLERLMKEWSLSLTHRDIFINYFREEIPRETEEFPLTEKEYDQRLIYKDLWTIFRSLILEEGPIDEIHLNIEGEYSQNTKKFLGFLEDSTEDLSIRLILNFTGQMISWDGLSQLPAYRIDDRLTEGDLYRKAMIFHVFGDHIIACQICEGLYQKGRRGELTLNIQQRASLFIIYGKSALYLNQDDMALTIFNSLMNLGKAWSNKEYVAEAYRLTGLVYHKRNYDKSALRFLRKSLDEYEKSDHPVQRLRTLYSLIQLDMPDALTPEEEEEALELIKIRALDKSEATFQIYRRNPDFNRIFEILKRDEDPLLLSEAYYRRAIIYLNNHNSTVEDDLKHSLKIGQNLNNNSVVNRAYNSLGDYYLRQEDYKKSFYKYKKALEGYLKAESYENMAHVYYQLALLAFLIFRPKICISFLNSSQYILSILIRTMPELEEKNQILGHLARMQDTGEIQNAPVAHACYESNRLSSEMSVFFEKIDQESEVRILEMIDNWSHQTHYKGEELCFLSLAIKCRAKGSNEILINKLRDIPALKGEMNLIVNILLKEETHLPFRCRWLKEPMDKELVIASLKQNRRLEQLKRKMHEMNLLSAVQMIFTQKSQKDVLLLQTMERLLTSFLVNRISYYEKLEDSFRLVYHSSTFDEQPDRSLLDEYLIETHVTKGNTPIMIRGFLCIPVTTESHSLEGIIIGKMEESSLNSEENDIQFFSILASQLGSALEQIKQKELIIMKNRQLEEINRELTKTTLTDSLTGIGNRMQLEVKMKEFAQRFGGSREGDNFCLVFIDLDFFKIYNDSYGHALGDKLLSQFTHLMRAACRESDGLFRYGGDEFILLLAGINAEQSIPIANRLLESLVEQKGFSRLIEEAGFKAPERKTWLSCSIGISDFIRAERDLDQLIEQADKAVYQAKDQGKRRWIIYEKGDTNE